MSTFLRVSYSRAPIRFVARIASHCIPTYVHIPTRCVERSLAVTDGARISRLLGQAFFPSTNPPHALLQRAALRRLLDWTGRDTGVRVRRPPDCQRTTHTHTHVFCDDAFPLIQYNTFHRERTYSYSYSYSLICSATVANPLLAVIKGRLAILARMN